MAKGHARSVRFEATDDAEIEAYVAATGESASTLLARASLRGIREERLERAIVSYLDHRDLDAATAEAALPRAVFIRELLDRSIAILDEEPRGLPRDLAVLAARTSDDALLAGLQAAASSAELPL